MKGEGGGVQIDPSSDKTIPKKTSFIRIKLVFRKVILLNINHTEGYV